MIKAEIFQDTLVVLDQYGCIWQIEIGFNRQPEIRLLKQISREKINYIMLPKLLVEVELV